MSAPGLTDLHTLATVQIALDVSLHQDLARDDVRSDATARANGDLTLVNPNLSLDITIDEQVFAARDFTFDDQSRAHMSGRGRGRTTLSGGRYRCCCWRYRGYRNRFYWCGRVRLWGYRRACGDLGGRRLGLGLFLLSPHESTFSGKTLAMTGRGPRGTRA